MYCTDLRTCVCTGMAFVTSQRLQFKLDLSIVICFSVKLMKVLMFSQDDSWNIFKMLAAILHIGNLEFEGIVMILS